MGLAAVPQSPLWVASGRPHPQAPGRAQLSGLAPLGDNIRSCRCLGVQHPPQSRGSLPGPVSSCHHKPLPRPTHHSALYNQRKKEWLLLTEEGALRWLPWLLSPKQPLAWSHAGDREKGPVPTGNVDCPAGCAERDPSPRAIVPQLISHGCLAMDLSCLPGTGDESLFTP